MDLTLLLTSIVSTVIGALLTFMIQKIVNRRGLFTYFVQHNKVGTSAEDTVFGTVRVTWNNSPVGHLYLSVMELKNDSLQDYEDVVVKVFSNDTYLLTEQSEIIGTTYAPQWTEDFSKALAVGLNDQPTDVQIAQYRRQREYLIPTMNRGQIIRFAYLNAALSEVQPALWIDIIHKGVKVKYREPPNTFMGVPQPHAAAVGAAFGVLVLSAVVSYVDIVWLASVICLVYGFTVVLPGVALIKAYHWLRDVIAG